MSQKKVAIFGFGFSGLSAAWAFLRQGYKVEVFEKSPQVGGLLQTKESEFGLIETAANAILNSKSVEAMAEDFKITWAERKKTAKAKWVYTDKPRRWPLSVKETTQVLIPIYQLARKNPKLEPLFMETVEEWGLRVFGKKFVADHLLGPALQGIYAQGPEKLSASLCLKTLFAKEPIKNKGSYAPANGMSEFFNKGLVYFDRHKEFQIHLNSTSKVSESDADLILDTRPDYENVNYMSVISVTMFFESSHRPKFHGFGCLFAKSKTILGVLFNSDIFEGRSKQGVFSETWIVSDEYKDDTDVVDEILSFREKKFKISEKPIYYHVTSWPRGIPSYDIKHEQFLNSEFELETKVLKTSCVRIGNYTGDIGLNKILEKTVKIANQYRF